MWKQKCTLDYCIFGFTQITHTVHDSTYSTQYISVSRLEPTVCQTQRTAVREGLWRKPQQRAPTPNTRALTLQQARSHCCLQSWPRLLTTEQHLKPTHSERHTAENHSSSGTAAWGGSLTEEWATRSLLTLNSFQKSWNWMRPCSSKNVHIHWKPTKDVCLGSSRKFGITRIHQAGWENLLHQVFPTFSTAHSDLFGRRKSDQCWLVQNQSMQSD